MKTFLKGEFSPILGGGGRSSCVILILLVSICNVSISIPSQRGGSSPATTSHSDTQVRGGESQRNSNGQRRNDVTTPPSTTTTDNGESSEDGQYYDDDAAVTFITDEDIYDDMTYSPTSQHAFYQNRKHVEDERCPPHQEPALSATKLCEATRCQRDSDCSVDSSLICCYNGCIHSCLPRVDPPLAFDWLEETELKMFRNGSEDMLNLSIPPGGGGGGRASSPKMLMNAEVTPETIALAGGCTITPIQYEDLKLFRKHEHVRTCTCLKGDVVCEVNVDRKRLLPATTPTSSNTNTQSPTSTIQASARQGSTSLG